MSKKRRQHSAALKAQVGLEALKEIQPVHVIAAKHQVHPTQVNQWKKEVAERLPEVFAGKPDTDAAAARVRERITVAEVSVRRAWPSTLAVDIVLLRTPAIVMRNPQGQLEVVDAEGVSFGVVKAAPKGVPVVKAVGAKGATREALQSALALLNALPSDLSSQVSGITVSSANLVTFTLGKRTVVWGSGADSERKVAILTALLPTKAKVIDVSAPETPVTR